MSRYRQVEENTRNWKELLLSLNYSIPMEETASSWTPVWRLLDDEQTRVLELYSGRLHRTNIMNDAIRDDRSASWSNWEHVLAWHNANAGQSNNVMSGPRSMLYFYSSPLSAATTSRQLNRRCAVIPYDGFMHYRDNEPEILSVFLRSAIRRFDDSIAKRNNECLARLIRVFFCVCLSAYYDYQYY